MKIYGYTIVDTEGFGDGSESYTNAFASKEERNRKAYEHYSREFDYAVENDELDDEDTEKLTYEDFISHFEKGYVLIQRWDSHYQNESWEKEL